MLKKSIGMALLCIAGQAYSADITVTTTEDIVNDDEECSLREAIQYVNRGLAKEGYMGCGGENSTSNILLKEKTTYFLDQHVEILASLSIKAISDDEGTIQGDERVLGLNNAHIQMRGKDNIFRINSADDGSVLVTLKELDLEGCGQSFCAEQGGLIYNKGMLNLDYIKLFKGQANFGGAIYSVGFYGTNQQSRVEIKSSLFEYNKANFGGILYTGLPNYAITQSVFKQNETLQSGSANIFSQPYDKPENLQVITAKALNSTFLKNKGGVLYVVDGIGLNNITVVDNIGPAIQFNAPEGLAYLTNSIIMQNSSADCQFDSADDTILQNNLSSASCGTGDSSHPNQIWSSTQIFAGNNSEGVCQSLADNDSAILCPYSVPEGSFLGYLRPRILLSYNMIEDSPILNKGTSLSTVSPSISCESNDQRGINRLIDNAYCDRGSIEITVPTSVSLVGQDLLVGEVAQFSISSKLGDSDLIPKEECQAIVGDSPNGEPWQDGCMKIVQTKTTSKGKTTIDIQGNVTYTPNSAWHGADIFEIQVVTSSTRFNKTKPYLTISTQIVQAPQSDFEDKEVKTSGGSWGFTALLGLFGLIGLRRVFKN